MMKLAMYHFLVSSVLHFGIVKTYRTYHGNDRINKIQLPICFILDKTVFVSGDSGGNSGMPGQLDQHGHKYMYCSSSSSFSSLPNVFCSGLSSDFYSKFVKILKLVFSSPLI